MQKFIPFDENGNKNSVKHNEVGKSATAGCKNLVVTGAASTA